MTGGFVQHNQVFGSRASMWRSFSTLLALATLLSACNAAELSDLCGPAYKSLAAGLECNTSDIQLVSAFEPNTWQFEVPKNPDFHLVVRMRVLRGDAYITISPLNNSNIVFHNVASLRSTYHDNVVVVKGSDLAQHAGTWVVTTSCATYTSFFALVQLQVSTYSPPAVMVADEQEAAAELFNECCGKDPSACPTLRRAQGIGNSSSIDAIDLCSIPPNKCDAKGNLITLSLVSEGLTCRLPSFLSAYKAIQHINLYLNNIDGRVDALFNDTEPDSFSQLKELVLGNNQLTGTVPCGLASLPSLQTIDLRRNALSGGIPSCLVSKAPALTELFLSENEFNGTLPAPTADSKIALYLVAGENSFIKLTGSLPDFSAASNLIMLDITQHSFAGPVPALPKSLLYLHLAQNRLTGTIPDSIGTLQSARVIELQSNSLVGGVPASVMTLPQLHALDVSANTLNAAMSDSWKLPQAVLVSWNNNNFTGAMPASIVANSPKLAMLNVADNRLSGGLDAFSAALTGSNALYYFSAQNNAFDGTLPAAIANMRAFLTTQAFVGGRVLSNLFDISGNALHGVFPDFLMAARLHMGGYLQIDTFGNQLTCPQNIDNSVFAAVSLSTPDRLNLLSSLPCVGFNGTSTNLAVIYQAQLQAAMDAANAKTDGTKALGAGMAVLAVILAVVFGVAAYYGRRYYKTQHKDKYVKWRDNELAALPDGLARLAVKDYDLGPFKSRHSLSRAESMSRHNSYQLISQRSQGSMGFGIV